MAGSKGRLMPTLNTKEKQHTVLNGENGTVIMMKKETVITLLLHGGTTLKIRPPKNSPKITNKKGGIATWFNPPWSTQPQAKFPKSKTLPTNLTKMNLFLVGLQKLDAKFETA